MLALFKGNKTKDDAGRTPRILGPTSARQFYFSSAAFFPTRATALPVDFHSLTPQARCWRASGALRLSAALVEECGVLRTERLSTGLNCRRCGSVVVGKGFRHLIRTECEHKDDQQEGDTEHTITRGQSAKEKSEQKPHRSHFSRPKPKPRPISNKIRPETTPTATHRRTADRE